jgi:hypothetical protein
VRISFFLKIPFHALQEYWPFLHTSTLTPLLTSILHSALTLLAGTLASSNPTPLSPAFLFSSPSFSPPAFSSPNLSQSTPAYSSRASVFPIMRLFQTCILPTVELLRLTECRSSVVVMLCHINFVNASQGRKGKEKAVEGGWEYWVREKVNGWCMDKGWKEVLEEATKSLVRSCSFPVFVIRTKPGFVDPRYSTLHFSPRNHRVT